MSTRFAFALPLILALAACSTPTQRVERLAESEYDPSSSFARNVMMASGRTMIRDDVGPEGGSVTARQGGGSVSTIGAGVLTGNPGLGVGLGLLRGLTGPGYNQGTSNMVIAWMPAEMAVDGIDARNKLNDNVRNSLTIAFEKKNIPYSTSDYGLDLSLSYIPIPLNVSFMINGCDPMCGPHDIGTGRPLAFTGTPRFLGNGSSYATLGGRDYGTPIWDRLSAGLSDYSLRNDELAIYVEMSRHLPKWAFIYLAPNQWVSCMADGCRPRPYPLLLHQGEIHSFTRPGTDVATRE